MLTTSFVAGLNANTCERERLGWINPTIVTAGYTSLSDFITTGVAYKFHPPAGATNEWYYFENHQKLSIYDDATTNSTDKGIWVIHQLNIYNGTNNIRVKPQDGFWDWENPHFNTTCFPPAIIGVFRKLSVNRNAAGLSIRDQILNVNSVFEWPHGYLDQTGPEICGGFFRGDPPFYGAFNPTTNNVFSRWSNPSANTWTDAAVDFAMEVLSQSGSTVNVRFYVGNPLDAPPSKPQNLVFTNANQNNQWPNLVWTANIEPDLLGYDVWREYRQGNGYTETTKVGSLVTMTSFTDYGIKTANTGSNTITYWINGVDNTSKISVASDKVTSKSRFMPSIQTRESSVVGSEEFLVGQNYPNPFNPETEIFFSLPEPAHVRITISDVLGREILTLQNGDLNAGQHQKRWNGVNGAGEKVGSGIYFYRITVTSESGKRFTRVMKMALTK